MTSKCCVKLFSLIFILKCLSKFNLSPKITMHILCTSLHTLLRVHVRNIQDILSLVVISFHSDDLYVWRLIKYWHFKGAVSQQSSPICLVFPITRPSLLWNLTLAEKLLVNDKITASRQTNIPSVIFIFTNNGDKLSKLFSLLVFPPKTANAIRINLLQFGPSVPFFVCLLCYLNLLSMF